MNSPFGIPDVSFGHNGNRRNSKRTTNLGGASLPFSPLAIGIALVVLIVFIGFFATVSSSSSAPNKESSSLVGLDILLWGCLVFLVLVNGMSYLFNLDVTASLRGLFTDDPSVVVKVAEPSEMSKVVKARKPLPIDSNEVFHVTDNKYTFDDAKAICKAYGGRLATIKEMQKAYRKGANWCSYGWSDGQMALYPTQYERWEELQKIKGHEHDCGRPGLNGGYIANPNVRFGANCYGKKRSPNRYEKRQMKNRPLYPLTNKEIRFNRQVQDWRSKLNELTLSPFNNTKWFG